MAAQALGPSPDRDDPCSLLNGVYSRSSSHGLTPTTQDENTARRAERARRPRSAEGETVGGYFRNSRRHVRRRTPGKHENAAQRRPQSLDRDSVKGFGPAERSEKVVFGIADATCISTPYRTKTQREESPIASHAAVVWQPRLWARRAGRRWLSSQQTPPQWSHLPQWFSDSASPPVPYPSASAAAGWERVTRFRARKVRALLCVRGEGSAGPSGH